MQNCDESEKERKEKKTCFGEKFKMVKEEHLVFNLIPPEDLAIPDEALAVLLYGEGFVPTPKVDKEHFRLQASNTKKKLEKCANSQAKKLYQVAVKKHTAIVIQMPH